MDSDLKESFTKLHASLHAKSLEEFFAELETCALKCEIMFKKIEKKSERVLSSEHRQSLLLQLNEATEAALILHLVVLLLIQRHYNELVHASGKFVPQLLSFLKPKLENEVFEILYETQEMVVKQLTLEENEEKKEISKKLEAIIPKIREIGTTQVKKTDL